MDKTDVSDEKPFLLTPIEDKNAKIWRYMDFTKFVELLEEESLFFTRVDKLDDPFEGFCPESVIRFWKENTKHDNFHEYYKHLRKFTAVNCWHLNDYESAAMWKLYLRSNEGIAILSTFNRLNKVLHGKKHDVSIGKVSYIDFNNYEPDRSFIQPFYPFINKRKSFEYEKELRAIVQGFYYNKKGEMVFNKSPFKDGVMINVDLNELIDKIYVAPTTPKWQLKIVKTVLKRYNLDKDVLQSNLDDSPLY